MGGGLGVATGTVRGAGNKEKKQMRTKHSDHTAYPLSAIQNSGYLPEV